MTDLFNTAQRKGFSVPSVPWPGTDPGKTLAASAPMPTAVKNKVESIPPLPEPNSFFRSGDDEKKANPFIGTYGLEKIFGKRS